MQTAEINFRTTFPKFYPSFRLEETSRSCLLRQTESGIRNLNYTCLQIQTVGKIPSGFPSPTFSNFETGGKFGKLLITSLIVTGVGILETVGIAKALAAMNGHEINATR
jgi:MFS superfamily sulfate permease-like transporter